MLLFDFNYLFPYRIFPAFKNSNLPKISKRAINAILNSSKHWKAGLQDNVWRCIWITKALKPGFDFEHVQVPEKTNEKNCIFTYYIEYLRLVLCFRTKSKF